MSIGMVITSALWFVVRVILEMPTGTPLFSGTAFTWADTLAAAFGVAGIVSLIFEHF